MLVELIILLAVVLETELAGARQQEMVAQQY
jgi:hypothetical protein